MAPWHWRIRSDQAFLDLRSLPLKRGQFPSDILSSGNQTAKVLEDSQLGNHTKKIQGCGTHGVVSSGAVELEQLKDLLL
jgi:hypothetical protein